MNMVLIGHNSNTFDTPVLLRTILHYCPELIQRLKDLNICFADTLSLFRNLVKDKREAQLCTNTFLTVILTSTMQLKM